MDREQLRISLVDLADGALAPDEARAIEAVLEEHPDLRAEFDDMRQAVELARSLPPMTLPTDLTERIRRAVSETVPASPRPTLSIWVWVTGAAAALLLAGIGIRLFDALPPADKARMTGLIAADAPAEEGVLDAGPPAAAPADSPAESPAESAAESPKVRADRRGAFARDGGENQARRGAGTQASPPEESGRAGLRKKGGLGAGKAAEVATDRNGEAAGTEAEDRLGPEAAKKDASRENADRKVRSGKGAIPRPAAPAKRDEPGWTADGGKRAPAARPRLREPRAAARRPADDGTTGVLSIEVARDDAPRVRALIVRFLLDRSSPARAVPASGRASRRDFGSRALALEVTLGEDEIAALRRTLGDAARVVSGARSTASGLVAAGSPPAPAPGATTKRAAAESPRAAKRAAPAATRVPDRSSTGHAATGGGRESQTEPQPGRLERKRWLLVILVK